MKDDNIFAHPSQGICDPLTDILRGGAWKLIEQAVEAELADLLGRYANDKLPVGRSRLVRNGYLLEHEPEMPLDL